MNIPDGWNIEKNIKPIPDRRHDYDFWHDDLDIDSDQILCGTAASVDDAINQINEIIENGCDYRF